MYYFAYGSNLNLKWMKKRCPETVLVGPAALADYKLAFRYKSTSWPGGGAADIIYCPGQVVWGGLYLSNQQDFASLGKYEDVADGGYERIEVQVKLEEQLINAISYQVSDKLPEDLRPRPEYLQLMVEGAKQIPLPEDYIQKMAEYWRKN
jgi:gamma-glutamylcyclotransferase (GGCT)/AIG2-like uncharacterized protein YtfP